jgi:hypothetical protein
LGKRCRVPRLGESPSHRRLARRPRWHSAASRATGNATKAEPRRSPIFQHGDHGECLLARSAGILLRSLRVLRVKSYLAAM